MLEVLEYRYVAVSAFLTISMLHTYIHVYVHLTLLYSKLIKETQHTKG